MTFVVLAPEHPLVDEITTARAPRPRSSAFVERVRPSPTSSASRAESSVDKRGVFTGAYAINPFNGQAGADLPGRLRADDLRHRRHHGRARPRTSGTGTSPRPTGCRSSAPSQPPEGWEGEAYTGDGPRINSDWLNGIVDTAEAKATGHRLGRGTRASVSARSIPAAGLAGVAASATGVARSRSSTALTTG